MIGREDIDFLAKKLGYGDMNALQEERKAEARARAEAKRAEEERARMEEARRYQEAIDREIVEGFPRMTVTINGQNVELQDIKDLGKMTCPECEKPLSYARDLMLQAVRGANLHGDDYRNLLNKPFGHYLTTISADNDRLPQIPEVITFQGKCRCPECKASFPIYIRALCVHDGELVRRPSCP
ncbi:MAG: hypothetical protein GXX95_00940 [Methanomassiliicoccus sp.]|nr:hypothetical protein [Methanomassiliicoccus sp.]